MRRAALVALTFGVLTWAGASQAIPVAFDTPAGFDNSTANLASEFEIELKDVLPAGQIPSGLPIEISETQCLKLQSNPGGACNDVLAEGEGPYFSEVTWDVTNNTDNDGPALLFISALQDFTAGESYDPSDIEIETDSGGSIPLRVIELDMMGTPVFFLGFLIEDFDDDVTFRYNVNALQIFPGGTPQLLTNASFEFTPVPEPSTAFMLALGLAGLARFGNRRNA